MQDNTNARSESTTLVWKLAKISRPPKGHKDSAPKAHRWLHRPRLAWGTPVTLKLHYVGGATGKIVVRARGGVGYYDGGETLIDVLADVQNQRRPPYDRSS